MLAVEARFEAHNSSERTLERHIANKRRRYL